MKKAGPVIAGMLLRRLQRSERPAFPADPHGGFGVRRLGAAAFSIVHDHLVAMGPEGLRARFGMDVGADFILAHAARATSDACMTVGAFLGDEICAMAELHRHGPEGAGDVELALSVAPDFQSRGIGTALATDMMSAAATLSARTVYACFEADNIRMRRIASRLGMRLAHDGRMIVGQIRLSTAALSRPAAPIMQ